MTPAARRVIDPARVGVSAHGSFAPCLLTCYFEAPSPSGCCLHSFALHAVVSGLGLFTVGRLLGHADIPSTERYAHLADNEIRGAAERITGIIGYAITGGPNREEVLRGA